MILSENRFHFPDQALKHDSIRPTRRKRASAGDGDAWRNWNFAGYSWLGRAVLGHTIRPKPQRSSQQCGSVRRVEARRCAEPSNCKNV